MTREAVAYRRCVIAATVLGATLRLVMLVSKWNTKLMLNDSLYYSIQASNNAHGRWFKEARGSNIADWGVLPGAEHPPLTSVVMVPASWLPHPEFWQRATLTALGIAVIPLVAMLARKVAGRRVAVIAAALAAVYPNLWLSDALIMSESLMLFLFVITMIVAVRYRDRFDLRTAAILGVMIGITGHARSEILLYGALFVLIGFRSHTSTVWLKRGSVMGLAAVVTVLPWAVYNSTRFDAIVVMSTNDGNTLLGANCPATYSGPGIGGWNVTCLGPEADQPPGDSAVRSGTLRRQAMSYAVHNVSRWVYVVPARVLRSLDLYGVSDNTRADVGEERPQWGVWAGIASWWVLAPMAGVGLWRTRRGLRYLLSIPLIGVLAVSAAFYGSHRLRAPLEPLVVLCAAMFIAALPSVTRLFDERVARLSAEEDVLPT